MATGKLIQLLFFLGLYKAFKETAERAECLKEETCQGMIIKSSLSLIENSCSLAQAVPN